MPRHSTPATSVSSFTSPASPMTYTFPVTPLARRYSAAAKAEESTLSCVACMPATRASTST